MSRKDHTNIGLHTSGCYNWAHAPWVDSVSFGDQRYSRSSPPPSPSSSSSSTNWVIQNRAQTRRPCDSIWLEYYRRAVRPGSRAAWEECSPRFRASTRPSAATADPQVPPNPPPHPHLGPISQQDPWGHFQKQSLSLSSREVPGLIINKLLMF